MKFIGAGVRSIMMAVTMGDPLWPAVTLFLVSIAVAVIVFALRHRS
ncbi:hypothetical protein [Kitasatospora sp. NPDC059827]